MTRARLFLRLGFAVVMAAISGCRRERIAAAAAERRPLRVQTAVVAREDLPVRFEIAGTVRAVHRAVLATKIGGPVGTLHFNLGQAVRAGDVLLTISAGELDARAAQARAGLQQVERELARERGLLATQASAAEDVKTLEDRLAQSRAVADEADTLRGYATVRAPFDGFVAAKNIEAGEFAAPGAPLLQLDGRDGLELETAIPESLARSLAPGAKLDIEVPAAEAHFSATITQISSAADPATRAIVTRLAIPAGVAVRPGQFARVFVPGTPAPALLVPADAVAAFGQMERVFVVAENHRAVLRLVKTSGVRDGRIDVAGGLDAGERVVVAPPADLRDGQQIEIAP